MRIVVVAATVGERRRDREAAGVKRRRSGCDGPRTCWGSSRIGRERPSPFAQPGRDPCVVSQCDDAGCERFLDDNDAAAWREHRRGPHECPRRSLAPRLRILKTTSLDGRSVRTTHLPPIRTGGIGPPSSPSPRDGTIGAIWRTGPNQSRIRWNPNQSRIRWNPNQSRIRWNGDCSALTVSMRQPTLTAPSR